MSGFVTSIGKVFTTVAKGVSTVLGKAVTGVGAVAGTAGAAAGGGVTSGALAAAGSMPFSGSGLLSTLLGGARNVVGAIGSGAKGLLAGAADVASSATADATAAGVLKGGMVPKTAGSSFLSKAGDFLKSEGGAGLIAGLGKGLGALAEARMNSEERQKDRDFLFDKEMRIRDSYELPADVLPDGRSTGVVKDTAQRPTPDQAYGRGYAWVYKPDLGRMVKEYN